MQNVFLRFMLAEISKTGFQRVGVDSQKSIISRGRFKISFRKKPCISMARGYFPKIWVHGGVRRASGNRYPISDQTLTIFRLRKQLRRASNSQS